MRHHFPSTNPVTVGSCSGVRHVLEDIAKVISRRHSTLHRSVVFELSELTSFPDTLRNGKEAFRRALP